MSWLPRWLEYGLVLLAAWLMAGLFVTNSPMQGKSQLLSGQAIQTTMQQLPTERFLSKVHLFGEPLKQEVKREKQVAVVDSKLNVKLIGTVVAGVKSAAVVSVNGSQKQQVFFLDEEIQPQVVLRAVEATEIVVENHGKRERISIEAGKSIVAVQSNQVRQVARPAARRLDRRIDKRHLQSQMRNFSTLLSQARVTPHFTNKKADGFIISEIVKGSLYEEIGLKNGDVIQKVNGESVTSAEQAMRMYRELQNSTFIDVEINRGGSLQQVSYSIQ